MAYVADVQSSVKEVETRNLVQRNAPTFARLKCVRLNQAVTCLQNSFASFQVESASVLYCKDDIWTVIDFSTDSTCWADRYRKLYNALLCFWQKFGMGPVGMRQKIDYVLVSVDISKKHRLNGFGGGSREHLHSHYANVRSRPWEYDENAIRHLRGVPHDMRKMSDYLVRKAYFVFPQEMDLYAGINGWSNV